MTGYGVGVASSLLVRYTVEIKSLNSKFFELTLKLPRQFNDKEFGIRSESAKRLERGKVMISVTAESLVKETNVGLNFKTDLIKRYYQELVVLANEFGEPTDGLLPKIISLPMILEQPEEQASEEDWLSLWAAFEMAYEAFDVFRAQEGRVLAIEVRGRVETILQLLEEVELFESQRMDLVRERILKLMEDYVGSEALDKNRFEQELIYHIEKLDVTEEKVRLRSHADYFFCTLADDLSNGKKLGFIVQEIGREINTLGSKSNNAAMQRLVVCMKDELEKIKEQLLNIL